MNSKNRIVCGSVLLLVLFITTTNAVAQTTLDSIRVIKGDSVSYKLIERDSSGANLTNLSNDTLSKKNEPKKRKELSKPKKAMLYAMVLPGAGQIYNKRYWKLPILYGGAAALTYFWITNQQLYSEFKHEHTNQYNILKDNPSYTFVYYSASTNYYYTTLAQLGSDRDTYRRYRDECIAGAVFLYAISILDAYVDAHLKEFDLNPNLSFSIKPLFYKYNNATFVPGVSLNFKVKNNRASNFKLVHY